MVTSAHPRGSRRHGGIDDILAQRMAAHDRLAHQSQVVLRLGQMLLSFGASAYRVKKSMADVARAVGISEHRAQVTLSVPAVVIMIPGVPLYRALTYLNNQQIDDALGALFTVIFTIVAIGMGLALSRMLTDKNWLMEKQERVPNLWEFKDENA